MLLDSGTESPIAQGVRCGDFVFVSGQGPLDPVTKQIVSDDIAEQTRVTLDNVRVVLEAAGTSMEHVVKVGVFLRDMKDFGVFNRVFKDYMKGVQPARTTGSSLRIERKGRFMIHGTARHPFLVRRHSFAFRSAALVILLALAGCATGDMGTKTAIGGVGGAALGGLIAAAAGGRGTGIAAGVIGGALVGGLVGNLLDSRDKKMASESTHRALEGSRSGQTTTWTNPDTGASGTVTPTRTYQSGGGYCREYQQTVTIGGKQEQSYGTACRQPDGSWKTVS